MVETEAVPGELFRQAVRLETEQPARQTEVRLWYESQRLAGWRTAWIEAAQPGAGRDCLGRTLDVAVFDATAGFDPEAFARVCAAVRGGGVFVLVTPPLRRWLQLGDAMLARVDAWGVRPGRRGFLERLVRLLEERGVFRHCPGAEALPEPARVAEPDLHAIRAAWLTPDQKAALDQLHRVGAADDPYPLLLAPRGRGKSTVLGLHAARLRREGREPVVTAPSRGHASTLLATAEAVGQRLNFMAPDRLLEAGMAPEAVLVVDEAASIPLALLHALIRRRRALLAGTVEGYEGTGRGLLQRLLTGLGRPVRRITLTRPVRWKSGDPLETFLSDLLLFDRAYAVDLSRAPCPAADDLECFEISRDSLCNDESLLRETFGLLRDAHYRTRPFDLRILLDAGNVRLFAARREGRLLGVAQVLEEGPLPRDVVDAVHRGERRARGHLVPQSLAYHLNTPEAARLRCWRISRIAVRADCRRRGVGTALLSQVRECARTVGIDWLGVSFGVDPERLGFWYRNRYVPVRLGERPETASGALPLLMLHPLTPAGHRLTARLHARFVRDLPVQWQWMRHPPEPALRRRLLPVPRRAAPGMQPDDLASVAAFARTGNLHDHLPALLRWQSACSLRLPELEALVGRPGAATARGQGTSGGRAARIRALRHAVQEALEAGDGEPPRN